MDEQKKSVDDTTEKATVTLPGTVEKIIPGHGTHVPEKAQIVVDGAEDLYREIRIDNSLTDSDGNEHTLKVGSEVEVTIAADQDAVKPKQ